MEIASLVQRAIHHTTHRHMGLAILTGMVDLNMAKLTHHRAHPKVECRKSRLDVE